MERATGTSQEPAAVRRRGVALILTSALAAALLAVPVAGARAATVTKLADTDGECTPTDCSLREAIDSGDQVIDFTPGLAGRIDLQSRLPDLAEDVEIRGPGADVLTVRRDGDHIAPNFRVFKVSAGVSAEISGLTIANGTSFSNCDRYEGCPPDPDFGNGGGIENSRNATLMIRDSVVAGNEALGDGRGEDGSGGGIVNGGSLTLVNSTVKRNQAVVGAGIANTGAMTIVGSTVSRNGGGGFSGSSIHAGILNVGSLMLVNSTVAENRGEAAAISSEGGRLRVQASTIAGNRGLHAEGPQLSVIGTSPTFSSGSRNEMGQDGETTATLRSTIIAGGRGNAANCGEAWGASLISRGYNLADDRSCNLTRRTDQPNTDPGLGPLAENSGQTETMALLPASPAIDRGIGDELTIDQRGLLRPVDFPWIPNAPGGDGSDVGAFERQVLASNRLRFRKLIRDRTRGTATQRAWVSSRGRVVLRRTKKVRGFVRRVDGPGVVALRIRPRGAAKRRLAQAGESGDHVAVGIRARVTFTPSGGPPRTKDRRLRLVRVGDR